MSYESWLLQNSILRTVSRRCEKLVNVNMNINDGRSGLSMSWFLMNKKGEERKRKEEIKKQFLKVFH
jgi:hypothetical protein